MRGGRVEQLHVVVGGGAGVLFLLHGDAGHGGGAEVVVLAAQVHQLVVQVAPGQAGGELAPQHWAKLGTGWEPVCLVGWLVGWFLRPWPVLR